MGHDIRIINLLPRRIINSDASIALPRGMTHPTDVPCPFACDDFPFSSMGSCCSLRGEHLTDDLAALGETAACDRLCRGMNAEEALQFAMALRQIADRIRGQGFEEHAWAPFADRLATDEETGRSNPLLRSMIEGPVTTIRRAADWYEKVAHLGFGVECAR